MNSLRTTVVGSSGGSFATRNAAPVSSPRSNPPVSAVGGAVPAAVAANVRDELADTFFRDDGASFPVELFPDWAASRTEMTPRNSSCSAPTPCRSAPA